MVRLPLAGALLAVCVLVAAGSASSRGDAVPKAPTAAVCVPKTVRMEYFSFGGGKLGEYDAPFGKVVKVYPPDPYSYKCLWMTQPGGTTEAFVVFLDLIPAGVPGRIASGDCARNRRDNPPFYHSRKRYLTVSGGNRIESQRALGGNEKIIKGVLAAAEAAGVGVKCPGTKPPPKPPPPPKPKPPPKPPQPPLPASGDLLIDYRMPARFGRPGDNGLINYQDTLEEIHPSSWRVNFTVTRKDDRRCDGPLALTADKAVSLGSDGGCSFHATYRDEGTYTVSVSLTDGGKQLEGKRTFVVQDWLIVGLGDSNGSGEGAPDIPAEIGSRPARWQNRQCHRSANSYQAQTARSLERRDSRTSVTFVHLACSGATMLKGLLLEYEGIDPAAGDDLPPQIKEMKRLVGDREVDAVVISIGVNDLKFGTMVGHCIGNDDCPNVEFPEATSPRTLTQEIVRLLRLLPNRYAKVGAALEGAGVKPARVYLSEYFDSTRDDKGEFCDPLIYVPALGTFDRAEAKWAHDRVLVKLNEAVAAATKAQEWGATIRGAYLGFRPHGYCAKDTWIVSLTDSASTQFNKEGTLHSTPRGNTEQAKDATVVLRKAFYAGGRTRAPKG